MSLKTSFLRIRSGAREDFLVGVVSLLKAGVVDVVDCLELELLSVVGSCFFVLLFLTLLGVCSLPALALVLRSWGGCCGSWLTVSVVVFRLD